MIDWWWKPNTFVLGKDGLFWDSFPARTRSFIFITNATLSKTIGHQLIKVAQKRDPISCQLYRLVYGRLP